MMRFFKFLGVQKLLFKKKKQTATTNRALYQCPEILDIAIRHETELNALSLGKNCNHLPAA